MHDTTFFTFEIQSENLFLFSIEKIIDCYWSLYREDYNKPIIIFSNYKDYHYFFSKIVKIIYHKNYSIDIIRNLYVTSNMDMFFNCFDLIKRNNIKDAFIIYDQIKLKQLIKLLNNKTYFQVYFKNKNVFLSHEPLYDKLLKYLKKRFEFESIEKYEVHEIESDIGIHISKKWIHNRNNQPGFIPNEGEKKTTTEITTNKYGVFDFLDDDVVFADDMVELLEYLQELCKDPRNRIRSVSINIVYSNHEKERLFVKKDRIVYCIGYHQYTIKDLNDFFRNKEIKKFNTQTNYEE